MALIRYVPRGKGEYGTLTLGSKSIMFNSTFHKEFLGDCEKVALYYDEERRELALEPQTDGTGIVINKNGESRSIRTAGFYKFFKLCFTMPLLKKAVKKDGMIVVQI